MKDKPEAGAYTAEYLAETGQTELNKLKVVSDDWRVFVSNWGTFTACHEFYGSVEAARYSDLEELAKRIRNKARVKVSVPYVYMTYGGRSVGWRVKRGTATGVHGGTGNILGTEDGQSSQIDSGYTRKAFLRPLSTEDAGKAIELSNARDKADEDLKELLDKYTFPGGLKMAVGREIQAKMADKEARDGE